MLLANSITTFIFMDNYSRFWKVVLMFIYKYLKYWQYVMFGNLIISNAKLSKLSFISFPLNLFVLHIL